MPNLNPKAKIAMKAAWAMARRGRLIFGGHVRQYLAEALRQAWAEVKTDPLTHAVDELRARIRAGRSNPVAAPTPYLARFANARPYRRVWGNAYL